MIPPLVLWQVLHADTAPNGPSPFFECPWGKIRQHRLNAHPAKPRSDGGRLHRQISYVTDSRPFDIYIWPTNTLRLRARNKGRKNESVKMTRLFDPRQFRAPKHPIVLCHGLLGFDTIGPSFARLHYWRGVKEALESLGCTVYITKVPFAADVSIRAKALKASMESNILGKRVNLVAHSMGGLDCRYMISNLLNHSRPPFSVNSLTTVATPHHGSPIASFPLVSSVTLPMIKLLYTSTTLDFRAFTDLTPDYLTQEFNPATKDNQGVAYFSYGADGVESVYEKPFIYPLRLTYEYLAFKDGPNDGLVTVDSSRWGEYIRTLRADHIDLINLFNAWEWEKAIKGIKTAQKVQDAIGEPTGDAGAVDKAKMTAQAKVEEKKEEMVQNMKERSFNAIELYMEIATMLAEKGF
ncbi:Alpha/Beta hydrolase protein [Phlyctochytrium arcticum]|nr:Alpha/Beta hydrolase protein [Phlyctochytrium arcticum]